MPGLHPRRNDSNFLGVEPKFWYFLTLPKWEPQVARAEPLFKLRVPVPFYLIQTIEAQVDLKIQGDLTFFSMEYWLSETPSKQ